MSKVFEYFNELEKLNGPTIEPTQEDMEPTDEELEQIEIEAQAGNVTIETVWENWLGSDDIVD